MILLHLRSRSLRDERPLPMRGRFCFEETAPLKKHFLLILLFFSTLAVSATASTPTLGLAPTLDITSYSYPLMYYNSNSESNGHFGIGFNGHITSRLWKSIGFRLNAGYTLYETIDDRYIVLDENVYADSDGLLETTTTLFAQHYAINLMFGLDPPFYLLAGATYTNRHWHTTEFVLAPTKFMQVFDEYHFEDNHSETAYGASLGIGMRVARRFTVEGIITVDQEMTHLQISLNYLIPLTFLDKRK